VSTDKEIMESVRQGAFATDGQLWRNHLSAQARDVITRMLEVDPDKRISAQEALAHPFFREQAAVRTGAGAGEGAAARGGGGGGGGGDDGRNAAAEAAAMRGVLIARTSQHLKAKQNNMSQEEQPSGGGGSGGGGISGWLGGLFGRR
jgi:hypothetical protein